MGMETTAVYPVATVTTSSAPPPYTVGAGAAPVTVEMQPVVMQPVYVSQQQPTVVHTVHAVGVRDLNSNQSYSEFCPRCQITVITRTNTQLGACWWITFFLGCFFWPLWFFLCCTFTKDVAHFCPNCASMLSVKNGGCF